MHVQKYFPFIALLLLLLFSLFSLIRTMDYPLSDPDPLFDYLVARNATLYQEYPALMQTQVSTHSPAYVYLLSNMLHINDHIFTLTLFGFMFHVLSTAFVYILSFLWFGAYSAILATAMFICFSLALGQSAYAYPPYLMQPYFLFSLMCLTIGIKIKNPSIIYVAIVMYMLAGGLYISAFTLLPVMIVLFWRNLISFGYRRVQRGIIIAAAAGFFTHLPLLVYMVFTKEQFIFPNTLNTTASGYVQAILLNIKLFYTSIILPGIRSFTGSMHPEFFLILLLLGAFIAYKKHRMQFGLLALICISIPLSFLTISLFSVLFGVYHYAPVILLSIIALAYCATTVFSRLKLSAFFAVCASVYMALLSMKVISHFLVDYKTITRVAHTTYASLQRINESRSHDTWTFFQTKTLYQIPNERVSKKQHDDDTYAIRVIDDWILWPILVHMLPGKHFTNRPNSSYPSPNGSDEYIVFICNTQWHFSPAKTPQECKDMFVEQLPFYALVEHIYTDDIFTIFLYQKQNINPIVAYKKKGQQFAQNFQFSHAEQAYRKGLTFESKNQELLFLLGDSLLRQNKLDEAQKIFNDVMSINPQSEDAYLGLGRVSYMKGNYADAEMQFRTAINLNPNHATAYFDLGKLYRVLRNESASEKIFQQALRAHPDDIGIHYGLGYLYMQFRDFHKAEGMLKRAIQIDPTADGPYSALGDLYLRMDKFSESERMFAKARSINPESDVYTGLGELYIATNRFEEAENIFMEGLRKNPKAERYQSLGNLYLKTHRLEDAISMFTSSISINPNGNGYIGLGNAYQSMGMHKEAEETLKQCLATPFKAHAWLALGNLYIHTGRYKEAEEMLAKAITDAEIQPQAYISLGDLFVVTHKKQEARESYQNALKLDPNNEEVQKQLNQ